MAKYDLPAAF